MSLAFPSSPTTNQAVTIGGIDWIYNGTSWKRRPLAMKTINGVPLAGAGDALIPGSMVGTYTTTVALQTAFPAANNAGKTALIGAAAPYLEYKCDGVSWTANFTAAQVAPLTAHSDRLLSSPYTFTPGAMFRLKVVSTSASTVQIYGRDYLGAEVLVDTMNSAVAETKYYSFFADSYESFRLVIVSGTVTISYLN
jgi:hypothetical protein